MLVRPEHIKHALTNLGLLSESQLQRALQEHQSSGGRVGQIFVRLGFLKDEQAAEAIVPQIGLLPERTAALDVHPALIAKVPSTMAVAQRVVPLKEHAGRLILATDTALTFLVLEHLGAVLGCAVEATLTTTQDLDALLGRYYRQAPPSPAAAIAGSTVEPRPNVEMKMGAGAEEASEAPIIQLVSLVFADAVKRRASDIHIEPLADRVRVRYRVDGVLHEAHAPAKSLQGALTSRVKILAGMDIAEKRLPQDGRIQLTVERQPLDLRVSALPSLHGESIVMRILDRSSLLVGLEQAGLLPEDHARFTKLIRLPTGMILVTGPTGSGKTTTLYGVLSLLNTPAKKLITVEDPVEYQLAGINQVHVKPQIGLTFAAGLRSMLRQAPDVIMVGEIRDVETAQIAVQAALTGHLLLSTLHTNDAPGAVTRLIDMGIKPYLVASTVQAVLAQRLVRKICDGCARPAPPQPDVLGLTAAEAKAGTWRRGVGCDACGGTGYRGRLGLFELLVVSDRIRRLIVQQVTTQVLVQAAHDEGMRTLREDGQRKVLMGVTTPEEVLRVTQAES